jgi:DNA-binding NtrC family response regulator
MARLVGMDEFATKPIELDRLQRLIEDQVARHAADPEPEAAPAPRGQARARR